MKSCIKTALLLMALLLPASAAAHDIEVDGIYYNIYGNEAAVTYEGDDYDSNPDRYSGEVSIPETVTYDGVTYAVTAIDPEAFFYCNYMTSVTIPGSVTRINLSAFLGCRGLKSITIPGSVTHIDRQAFAYCSNLTALAIPASVSYIGYRAFDGCTGFQSITVDSGNRWYDSREDCNALIETATNTLIAGCKNTIIPNTVTIIGDNAFDGLTDLTHITIPNSVTSIGHNAFHSCRALAEITIPSSVTSIGGCAFAYCSSLTSVNIPSSVTSIGFSPFAGCSGLTSITVESGNPNYDSREDCNAIIEKATKTLLAGCRNTTIPNSVIIIAGDAFALCTGLTSVTIPASVISIGSDAFYNCNDLMDVYCHITNPSSVLVEYHAFYSDNNNSDRTLHVPHGTLEAYRTDENWYPYFGQIVEMEPETGLKGDVNHDGEVSIADVNAIFDIILGGDGDFNAADINGDGEVTIADVNAIIDIILAGGSPSQVNHEYVDLGLPSGTLWATCNVGASSPEEYGDYFAWGETAPKNYYDWSTYKWCNGSENSLTKYCTRFDCGTVDNKTVLDPADDAAFANWGPAWRTPTKSQYGELQQKCTWVWKAVNGVGGYLVTGPNGNSIFLPPAGYRKGSSQVVSGRNCRYWTRELWSAGDPAYARGMEFRGGFGATRDEGCVVRPVLASQNDAYIDQGSLDLGGAVIGETCSGELSVVNCTEMPLTMTASTNAPFSFKQGDNSAPTITIVVPASSSVQLPVMFTATTLGQFDGNVTIQSPAFDGGQQVIPVHAFAYTAPNPEQDYVDLGLPSGTLWATRDVGADSPGEVGDAFAWGETEPKDYYYWNTYKWCDGTEDVMTKYCIDSHYGTVDNLSELEPQDDAATVNLGQAWCMPSLEQMQELINNCTFNMAYFNGAMVTLVIGPNGNTMYMPLDCQYWSRTLNKNYTDWACGMTIVSGSWSGQIVNVARCFDLQVRAVRVSQE